MQAIITFFESIIGFVSTAIETVVWLVTMLPVYFEAVVSTVTFTPTFISGFLSISISATLLFAIIRLL